MLSSSIMFEAFLILFLIILNGFFSSAELAIISAKRSIIDKLSKEGNPSAALVNKMKEDPDRFLATVQIGVTVVSTLASVLGGVLASDQIQPLFNGITIGPLKNAAEIISVGAVVILISYTSLVIGELVPKSLAINYAERIACFAARPLDYMATATNFFVKLLTSSNSAVLAVLGIKDTGKRAFISEEEIKFFIKEGKATGVFEETEAQLLHGIFEFADTTVKEVMVPKHKISAIDIDMPASEIVKYIAETGFSRYPVYRKNMEKVAGILYNKDVFRELEQDKEVVVNEILRAPFFVPNSIMISRLLRELQRRKIHMAVVIDEHGDLDGLVTIEDILEEIVGEIEDEYDVGKGGLIEKLRDGTMVIDASASLGDLADLGIVIEEETEEYHTLAGFMLAELQRIPRGGEFVVYRNMRFTVVDVELNRIIKVKVELLDKTNGVKPAGKTI